MLKDASRDKPEIREMLKEASRDLMIQLHLTDDEIKTYEARRKMR